MSYVDGERPQLSTEHAIRHLTQELARDVSENEPVRRKTEAKIASFVSV
jgi:hypothetical protein